MNQVVSLQIRRKYSKFCMTKSKWQIKSLNVNPSINQSINQSRQASLTNLLGSTELRLASDASHQLARIDTFLEALEIRNILHTAHRRCDRWLHRGSSNRFVERRWLIVRRHGVLAAGHPPRSHTTHPRNSRWAQKTRWTHGGHFPQAGNHGRAARCDGGRHCSTASKNAPVNVVIIDHTFTE